MLVLVSTWRPHGWRVVMLNLVITLLVIALIAGLLGIFFVALVLFVVSLVFGGFRGSFNRRL
jgi:uncharacterized membrane protein YtjA (UPF0391 family)